LYFQCFSNWHGFCNEQDNTDTARTKGETIMQHGADMPSQSADEANVLKSTLMATVAALLVISTLFVTSFASMEAFASPARTGATSGTLVSVRYLA
jgi:hypothetical protein